MRTVVGIGTGPEDSTSRFSKTPGSIAFTGQTEVHRPQRVQRVVGPVDDVREVVQAKLMVVVEPSS